MLSFNSYIALSNINLIHKCLHDRAPQVLCDLVQLMQDVGRSTRSAAAGNCRVPHRKTSFGQYNVCAMYRTRLGNGRLV